MQVYRRIANPFMPQGTPNLTNAPSIPPYNPITSGVAPFYAPGEIGCRFVDGNTGNEYIRAIADSGATSATPVGAIAANQLAFWVNRATHVVTNDKRFCSVGPTGAVNEVAGIFQVAATPGYVVDLLVSGGAANVSSDGSGTPGCVVFADATANTARVVAAASVVTAPLSQPLGVLKTAGATAVVDVTVGEFIG